MTKSKIFKVIVFLLALALGIGVFILAINTCTLEKEVKTEGYFQYIVVGENSRVANCNNREVVAIVGFTNSGLEQEVIEIPRTIDGKPVQRIGYEDALCNERYNVYSENLKKVYIHDNIRYIRYFQNKDLSENESRVSLMFCSINDSLSMYNTMSVKDVYYYKSLIDTIDINRTLLPANIVFMNNYSDEINDGYYRLDNIETGETIPPPPDPTREGYAFTGWYTEAECANKWDFNIAPEIEEDTEFRLYAGWRAI